MELKGGKLDINKSMLPKFLNLAIKLAQTNEYYPKWPMASILVKGGSVQAVGFNKLKNSPLRSTSVCVGISTHAEIDSIRRIKEIKGMTLYLARINKNLKPALAKPCINCQKMLSLREIKQVIFTIDSNTFGVWRN